MENLDELNELFDIINKKDAELRVAKDKKEKFCQQRNVVFKELILKEIKPLIKIAKYYGDLELDFREYNEIDFIRYHIENDYLFINVDGLPTFDEFNEKNPISLYNMCKRTLDIYIPRIIKEYISKLEHDIEKKQKEIENYSTIPQEDTKEDYINKIIIVLINELKEEN